LAQYDVNLREYWRIIRKRKFIVLVIAVILGIFSTAFAILSAPAPIYSTECMIEFKRDRLVEGIYSKTIAYDDSDDIETQLAVIKSYAVFEKVAEHMGLIPRNPPSKSENQLKSHVIATIEGLQPKVEVSRVKYSSVLIIKVTDNSATFAQRLANTVALVFRELHAEQQTKRTKETLHYIDDQMKEVRARLRDAEDRFNRFSKDNELISIDLQSETLLKQTKEIQGELAKIEEEKRELGGLLNRLREFIKNPVGAGHNFDSIKANNRYQSANDTLVGLLLKRDTLLKDFTPKHPEVVAISNEISETAQKMEFMLDLQLKGLERRQADFSKELENINQKTKSLLDKKLEYGRLKREVELYTEMTTLLERKNQEALIQRSEKPEEVNIVKPALLPTTPINPPRTTATGAMGVIIGVVLGLIIAFIVETFDTSLGAIEDVEQTLGIPVLGVIPHVDLKVIQENIRERHSARVQDHSLKQAVNLISHLVPKSMMAESFRALRTNIHFKDTDKQIRSLAITSTSPQEGKTLIALNLAITMAQSGLKTLLVGSDLRKPMLAKVFGVPSSPGLSEILLGNYEWRETVRGVTDIVMGEISLDEIMITPGFDNFFFISGGAVPPNPADLIDSQRITRFIEEANDEYDMVLFDTAPILSAVDPAILGTKVDGMLLVYRIGTVPKGLLKRAINQLTQVKANVIGVILNGMRPEVSPDFENYKHYKYYYSYGEDGKKRRKKKSFTMFDTRDINLRGSDISSSAKVAGWAKKGWRKWKKTIGLPLMIVAGILLAGDLLWQNNILGLLNWNHTEPPRTTQEMKIPIKEQPAPPAPTGTDAPARTSPTRVEHQPLPHEPEETVPHASEQEKIVAAGAPKESLPASVPTIPLNEIKTASPVVPSRAEPVEKPEQKPSAEEPKAKAPAPAAVAPAEKIEANKTPEAKEGPQAEPAPPAAVAPAQKIEANKTPDAKEKPKAASAPAGSSSGVTYPFSLFLGSVPHMDQAEQGVSRYRKNGLPAYYTEVALSKGIWYRLYAGYFESEEQAEGFKKEKRLEEAEVKETPFTNLIGTFTSQDKLESKILSLKSLGFSPYVIRDADGKQRLVVGAFYNEERAKRQYEELISKGVENQIVQR
jgi:succinoglycan biosynthesis transport protein ExoP